MVACVMDACYKVCTQSGVSFGSYTGSSGTIQVCQHVILSVWIVSHNLRTGGQSLIPHGCLGSRWRAWTVFLEQTSEATSCTNFACLPDFSSVKFSISVGTSCSWILQNWWQVASLPVLSMVYEMCSYSTYAWKATTILPTLQKCKTWRNDSHCVCWGASMGASFSESLINLRTGGNIFFFENHVVQALHCSSCLNSVHELKWKTWTLYTN